MTRQVSVSVGVAVAVVLSVLAASAPPVGVADAEEVVQASDGLVVETNRADMTASPARAADQQQLEA